MTIEVEDLLKYSVVISVDDSVYHRFIDLFEWQNLKPIPRLYRGMKLHGVDWGSDSTFASFGQTQCMYSHLSIVKMAKFLDWPFVCIFEDDAYPCKDCRQQLEDSLKDLPDGIECLVLGHCYIEKHKYENSTKISCCDMLFGSQAYVIFKNGYDDYINLTERQNCLADRILDRMSNSYCINHNLFIQYNNKTSTVSHRDGYIWWKDKNANKYDDNIIFSQFPKIEEYNFLENITVNKQYSVCIQFMSHVVNDESIRRAQFIYDACQKMDYCFIWALDREHIVGNSSSIPKYMTKVYLQPCHILDCNVEPISKNIFSVAYNVLKYNSHFKYIWSIEYDVCYSGDWTDFFKRFENDDSDELLPDIINYEDYHKTWYWWQYINKEDLNDKWWRSRSQIFRLSRHAIESIKTFLDNNKQYYLISEIFLATAGHMHGLKMTDIANACDKSFDCYSKNIYDIEENDKLQHAIKLDIKWPDFNKEYFLKICIPSHNVEKTFRKTLDSIMNQTFKNFAVVICDDRSSDKTYQIAQEYASKHENVFVCQTKNGNNASIARNTAFRYPVKAKYTWFVDSDDWLIDNDAIKYIYDIAQSNDIDLIYHGIDNGIYDTYYNGPVFKIAKTELTPLFNEQLNRGINDVDHHVKLLNNIDPQKIASIHDKQIYFINGSHHDYSKLDMQYLIKIVDSINRIDCKNDKVRHTAQLKINAMIDQHIRPLARHGQQ